MIRSSLFLRLWTGPSPTPTSTSTNVRPKPLPRIKPKNAVPPPPIPVPRRSLTIVNQNYTNQSIPNTIPEKLETVVIETPIKPVSSTVESIQSKNSTEDNIRAFDNEYLQKTLNDLDHILETSSNSIDQQNSIEETESLNDTTSLRSETSLNSFGRQAGFRIGKSMLEMTKTESLPDTNQYIEENNNHFADPKLEIDDISLFDQKQDTHQTNKEYSKHLDSNIAEINAFSVNRKYEECFILRKKPSTSSVPSIDSVQSLRSIDGVPSFLLGGGGNIKKWDKVQNLDGISTDLNSTSMFSKKNRWGLGNRDSDAGMLKSFF